MRVQNPLTPLQSALPQNAPITRLESALPKSLDLKSFGIRTYKKWRGEGGKLLTSSLLPLLQDTHLHRQALVVRARTLRQLRGGACKVHRIPFRIAQLGKAPRPRRPFQFLNLVPQAFVVLVGPSVELVGSAGSLDRFPIRLSHSGH